MSEHQSTRSQLQRKQNSAPVNLLNLDHDRIAHDARETYDTHFAEHYGRRRGAYQLVSIRMSTLLLLCEVNFDWHRMGKASAAEAYPLSDRPLGEADIAGVERYAARLRAGEKLDPVVIIQVGLNSVFADGMHRAVACDQAGLKIDVVRYYYRPDFGEYLGLHDVVHAERACCGAPNDLCGWEFRHRLRNTRDIGVPLGGPGAQFAPPDDDY